jgi:hypothetical protein
VGTHHSSIELNGKRYDVHTGKLLVQDVAITPNAHPKPSRILREDVIKKPSAAKQVHSSPQHSKTLMRHAVKKPSKLTPPKPVSTSTVVDVVSPLRPLSTTSQTLLSKRQDREREKRAHHIKQSNLVSRFSSHAVPVQHTVTKTVQPLAVQPAPVLTHHFTALPAAEAMIERGLRAAQNHSAPKAHHRSKKSVHTKRASFAAASLAVLLFGAFFAFQNVPNVSMRYAASKSGVSAQLPGYKPSGFALSNRIQYTPGQVTLNFSSNSDERNFTLTQRSSTWNSDTLLSHYVTSNSEQFQTYEDKGRTIYLYGDSNATWVNGGVWYEIDGNSQLNRDQLIRIATSI